MKLIVNPHKIEIEKTPVNEREIDITRCEFEFADEITNDYVKEAYFTFNGKTYKQIIINDECSIPSEVLEEKGQVEIGVVAFKVENEEEIKRYNPSPAYFNTWLGSLKDNAENSEPITPSEMEQYEQALNDGLNEVANVNIDAEQLDNGMSVTITNRYGEDKTVYAYDGEKGETGATPNIQIGTVETGDHSAVTRTGTNENPIFNFVLEKGDKGDTGNGIASVTKTSTSGLTDTYTITFTNGNTTTFNVTNGKGISNIAKTSTSGLEDTYTITYNDNTTSTFTVTNGNGISSIEKTGTQDNVDTYTITYTNGTTSTFTVTNSTVTNQEFEELKSEHEELVNTLPRVEGTGESITLDNTAQYKMNVALSGNTSQGDNPTPDSPQDIHVVSGNNEVKVSNRNMFDSNNLTSLSIYRSSYSSLNTGVRMSIAQASTYTMAVFKIGLTKDLVGKKLRFSSLITPSGNNNGRYVLCYCNASGGDRTTIVYGTTSGGTISATIQEGNGDYVGLILYSNYSTAASSVSVGDYIDYTNIILTIDNENVNYIPHQSQTYPLNLGSLELCKLGNYQDYIKKSTGKNLFDKDSTTYITGNLQDNGSVNQYNANYITYNYINLADIGLKVGDKVTFSLINVYTSDTTTRRFQIYDNSNNVLFNSVLSGTTTVSTLSTTTTIPENATKIRFSIRVTDIQVQLEKGTQTSWEPHGIGNWYVMKNIGKVVLDGSESGWASYNSTNKSAVYRNADIWPTNNYIDAISDMFIYTKAGQSSLTDGQFKIQNKQLYLSLASEISITDLETLKTWISNNNITVYYVKATPTSEAITDTTLIEQLNNLYNQIKSYKGQTNITQTNAELPFNIDASALYDLNNLISRVATLEVEV